MSFATDRLVWAKMNAGQHVQKEQTIMLLFSKTYLHYYTLGNTRLLSPMPALLNWFLTKLPP